MRIPTLCWLTPTYVLEKSLLETRCVTLWLRAALSWATIGRCRRCRVRSPRKGLGGEDPGEGADVDGAAVHGILLPRELLLWRASQSIYMRSRASRDPDMSDWL